MPTKKSRPLATRTPTPKFQITERDANILDALCAHRVMNSEQIIALLGGSRTNILRRLMLLFNAGYLDRWSGQFKEFIPGGGSRPMIYLLGQRGWKYLVDWGLARKQRSDFGRKNREVKQNLVNHQLMVTQILVSLEVGASKIKGLGLMKEGEALSSLIGDYSGRCKRQGTKIKWPVTIKHQNTKTQFNINPDGFFALRYDPKLWPGKKVDYFFIEADTGSEPIFSHADFTRSAYFKKMLGYWATSSSGIDQKNLDLPNFRVLTVTKLPGRIDNLIKANKEVDSRGKGTRLFYFTHEAEIKLSDGNLILEDIWHNGRDGQKLSLIS